MHFPKRLLVLPALCLVFCAPLRAESLTVRADSWPPYNAEPASPLPGYVVELMKLVFPTDTIDYQITPWPRAVKDCSEGKIQAIIGALKTDAPGCIYPEEPAGCSRSAFFVPKDSTWTFTDIESLKKVKIGAISGYSYDNGPVDAYLTSATLPAVQLVGGDDPLQTNIRKLHAERINAIVEDPNVMNWVLKQMKVPATDFKLAGYASAEGNLIYVAFSPTHPESAARAAHWTETIRKLRADGSLAKILAKYDIADWQK
jgi:polar amino acid transport system substrate-binding protein